MCRRHGATSGQRRRATTPPDERSPPDTQPERSPRPTGPELLAGGRSGGIGAVSSDERPGSRLGGGGGAGAVMWDATRRGEREHRAEQGAPARSSSSRRRRRRRRWGRSNAGGRWSLWGNGGTAKPSPHERRAGGRAGACRCVLTRTRRHTLFPPLAWFSLGRSATHILHGNFSPPLLAGIASHTHPINASIHPSIANLLPADRERERASSSSFNN